MEVLRDDWYSEEVIAKKKRQLITLGVMLVGLVALVVAATGVVRYLTQASGTPANITVNLEGVIGPIPRPYRNLAQGGEELSSPMIDDVTTEVAALKPEYIRIDHIYDGYEVVGRGEGGQLTYDWTRLDQVVEDILKTGAKPFLALGYMPTVISDSDIVGQPRDYGEWSQVVRATIEHYSGGGGMNISGVYYEVWNEPDLFGQWKVYGEKNYLNLYAAAIGGARSASGVNSFKIGGPATTALYKNWVDTFLDYVAENNLRLDFYSWHRYDTDLAQYEEDVEQVRVWLEGHPQYAETELAITEWGHNSENDPGYDSTFGAIHTIAVSRVMMGRVNRGFVFEIKDGPGESQYWGRWGLLTHEKYGAPVKKPRYQALQFMDRLYPTRIGVSGEGSWVKAVGSTDSQGKYRVLLVNYDPRGQHVESVPVLFDNLPSGNFRYTRTDFLGGSKSLEVATSSAAWRTDEYMGVNSAAIIELEF